MRRQTFAHRAGGAGAHSKLYKRGTLVWRKITWPGLSHSQEICRRDDDTSQCIALAFAKNAGSPRQHPPPISVPQNAATTGFVSLVATTQTEIIAPYRLGSLERLSISVSPQCNGNSVEWRPVATCGAGRFKLRLFFSFKPNRGANNARVLGASVFGRNCKNKT